MLVGQPRGAAGLVDEHDDVGILEVEALHIRRLGVDAGFELAVTELVDGRGVVVEHDQAVAGGRVAAAVQGGEALDERHRHGLQAEIGHHDHLRLAGLAEALQLGLDHGADIRVARHVHDPRHVDELADHR